MGAVGTAAIALVVASAIGGGQRDGEASAWGKEDTSVRICIIALYEYEKHTLFHHLAYHRLIGVESAWVYIDDRTADPPESAAWLEALRSWAKYIRVFPWTTTRVGNQDEARGHCIRTTEAARDADWLAFPDGDEYMHFGRPRHRRANTSDWVAWSLPSVLRRVPDHILGLIMPRLTFYDVTAASGVPQTPVPPTETLGPFFFEPRAYVRTEADSTGPTYTTCFGKPIIRVGRGVGAWQHTVIEQYPPADVSNGSLTDRHYPAPLTSLRANMKCAFGWRKTGLFERFQEAGGQWPLGVDVTQLTESKFYEYRDLQLYHYYSRSYAECKLKEYRQGHGRDATLPVGVGKQHRALDFKNKVKGKCTIISNTNDQRARFVSGLSSASQATEDVLRSVWPRLAERVPVETLRMGSWLQAGEEN